jgi:short-subunit dehydrogenase
MQVSKMSAAEVAVAGYRAFREKQTVSVPGGKNKLLVHLTRILPRATIRRIAGRYNRLK